MARSIAVKLGAQAVGTTAVVTTKRWWRVVSVKTYVCVSASPLTGADWIPVGAADSFSGSDRVDEDLRMALNDAAQAAAHVMVLKQRKAL